jgi:hypothetical protein
MGTFTTKCSIIQRNDEKCGVLVLLTSLADKLWLLLAANFLANVLTKPQADSPVLQSS